MEYLRIFKDSADEWRWTRIAANGEPTDGSTEGYVNKDHALAQAVEVHPNVPVQIEVDE